MALIYPRSAWSRSRQSLRFISATRIAAPCSSSPSSTTISASRSATCYRSYRLARQTTALREQNDPLNQPVEEQDIENARPRWAHTPTALKRRFDFPLKEPKNPENAIWNVNEDPIKLEEFYEEFLGRSGARMLPEELRWLAVTHKSFDYGRRGFNTRLAFFGRQILVLEIVNTIMARPANVNKHLNDPWMREPFESPALRNVDKLSINRPVEFMKVEDLARIGISTGLDKVTRWKPRVTGDLRKSGFETVLATGIFAIIGAVSLQHGGMVASRLAREKVISRLAHEEY